MVPIIVSAVVFVKIDDNYNYYVTGRFENMTNVKRKQRLRKIGTHMHIVLI